MHFFRFPHSTKLIIKLVVSEISHQSGQQDMAVQATGLVGDKERITEFTTIAKKISPGSDKHLQNQVTQVSFNKNNQQILIYKIGNYI